MVLTPPIPGRLPYADTWQAAWDFVRETLPLEEEPFWAQDGIEAYRVVQPQAKTPSASIWGSRAPSPIAAKDGTPPRQTPRTMPPPSGPPTATSRLFVPLRDVDPGDLCSQRPGAPFVYPGSETQSVTLVVNGAPLSARPLTDGWQTVAWQVPGKRCRMG